MGKIEQKIHANAESICKTCIHNKVCRAIDNQPCVECSQYDPMKYGHNVYEKCASRFECSECGYEDWDTITCEPEHHNYCPNCGAKMDLEGPNEA